MTYFFDGNSILMKGINDIPNHAIPIDDELYQSIVDAMANNRTVSIKNGTIFFEQFNNESEAYELLIEQRDQIRQAINAKRDQTDASGVFVPQLGKWVDSDDKAYQNILGVKASLDLLGDMEISWTWADNTSSTINRQTLAVIVGALLQAKQANHANAIKHKEAVMLADNPLEYDYSTGWTKTYADFTKEQNNE
nr:MAG TPA: protein of unknown function (DUF4376) [Caudoviricetes sp.]